MFDRTPIPPPRRKRKEKLAKLHISPPKDFRHCAHIGPNDVNFNEQGERMVQQQPVAPTVHQMGSKNIAPTPTEQFFYDEQCYEKPSSMQRHLNGASSSGTVRSNTSLDSPIPVKSTEVAKTQDSESPPIHYENQPTKHHYVNQPPKNNNSNSTPRLSKKSHAPPPPPVSSLHEQSSDHEPLVIMRQVSTSSNISVERLDPPIINAPGRIERPPSELLNAVERPTQLGGMGMKLSLDDPIPIAGGTSSKYRSSSVTRSQSHSVSPNARPTPEGLAPVIPVQANYEKPRSNSHNTETSIYSVVNANSNDKPKSKSENQPSQSKSSPHNTVNLTMQGSEILSELIEWLDSMTETERKRVSDICFATTGKRNFPNDRQFIHELKAKIERERREGGLTTVSGVGGKNDLSQAPRKRSPLPPNMLAKNGSTTSQAHKPQTQQYIYQNLSKDDMSLPTNNGSRPISTNKTPLPKPRTKITSTSSNSSPPSNRTKTTSSSSTTSPQSHRRVNKENHFRQTRRISVDTTLEPIVESKFETTSRKSISDENILEKLAGEKKDIPKLERRDSNSSEQENQIIRF